MHDLRYAIRTLLKNPGFSLVAVLALALGIGANTAIFTIVNSVLLRPLPYPQAERLVFLERGFPDGDSISVSVFKADYWRRRARSFEAVAQADFMGGGVNLTGEEPERLRGIRVTADYFRVLGVAPAVGRGFTAEDDRPKSGKAAVLTHGLWQRRFGGDPKILGRNLTLNGEPVTVIGVMPQSFTGYPEADVYLPLQAVLDTTDQTNYLMCMARLRPGVSRAQAAAELRAIGEQMRREHRKHMVDRETAAVVPFHRELVGDVRPALLVLMGAVGAVLLIACANVANLLLARAAGREREIAIRMAVGAGRGRLVRQLLTESVLLALAGGGLGLALGLWGVRLLEAISPTRIPLVNISMDWGVLAFTVGVSVLTGVLFGLVPALQASRPHLSETLKEGSRGSSTGIRRNRTRSILVAAEVAIAVVVVIGAGLLVETFIRLRSVQVGFNPENVVTLQMSLSGTRFDTSAQVDSFTRRLVQRLEAVPGVKSAGSTNSLPLEGATDIPFTPEDGKSTALLNAQWRAVSAHYFSAMGMPVRRGRGFNENDTVNSLPVVIMNEAAVRAYYKGQDPLGQRLTIGKGIGDKYQDATRLVVGILADAREQSINRDPPPTLYVPECQISDYINALLHRVLPSTWAIRTVGDPLRLLPQIRAEIRAIERENPVANIRSMEQIVQDSTARQSFNMILLGAFGVLALLLAAVGIYGVMAYSVSQRTHEIGIRVALGANRLDVARLVVGHGMTLAGAGIAGGLVISYFATRLLAGMLFGVEPANLPTFIAVSGVIGLVSFLACYIPAWRATRVDPIVALRAE